MSGLHVIPQSWQWVTLQDIAEVVTGNTPPTADAENYGGDIPFFKPPQLNDSQVHTAPETLTKKGLERARLLPPRSVLVSCIGILGKTAITKTQSTSNQQINAVVFESLILPEYGFYYSQTLSSWLKENSSATTVAIINKGKFETAPFPVPPYPEQTRIVAKLEELLSDLDAGVAELKAAQKKLGQYRQSLLKAAVEGALTAEWRTHNTPTETGAQLLERILLERRTRWEAKQLAKFAEQDKTPPKDWQKKYPEPVQPDTSDLPALPEGWVWASVDQLTIVVRGASPRPAGDPRYFGGNIPWITVGSLTADENMFLDKTEQFVTAAGRDASRYIEPQTLLLTNSGATLGVPKITRIAGCINDGSVALLDVNVPLKTYLYWFLRTQTMKLRATNQGAAQPNLNTDIVKRICVPLCPEDEMRFINDLIGRAIEGIRNQETNIDNSLKQSTAQRQNILRAAFAGELVPQDPNDEPASRLLERIRTERAAQAAVKKPRGRKTHAQN